MLRILNTAKMTELQNTRIPRSLSEIRTFYTDSQQSIIQRMPIPQTFVYDNHVCVKINDVLNHIVLNGVDIPLMISDISSNKMSLLGTSKNTISDHEAQACNTNICNIVTGAISRHNQLESNTTQTEALLHIDVCDCMLKLSCTQQ